MITNHVNGHHLEFRDDFVSFYLPLLVLKSSMGLMDGTQHTSMTILFLECTNMILRAHYPIHCSHYRKLAIMLMPIIANTFHISNSAFYINLEILPFEQYILVMF